MDSLDKPKILIVDDNMRSTSKLMEYIQAYGGTVKLVNAGEIQVLNVSADEFTKPVPISFGSAFDLVYLDEVPECATHAEEDNHRSKDNFRPASDWNYLQLRKKKW